MNLESECGMSSASCGNGKLRQWLIEQIDSGKYPGLVWENEEKSIFRIPWKHAGKQDYNRDEDAALFKVMRVPAPRGRAKFLSFIFLGETGIKQLGVEDPQILMNHYPVPSSYTPLQPQVSNYMVNHERNWRDYVSDQPHPELPYPCASVPFPARSHHWQGPSCENGYQVTGSFYACAPSESQAPVIPMESSMRTGEALAMTDCRLHIYLYYREMLVKETTTTSPEGCRITHGPSLDEKLYGCSLDQVLFPYPDASAQRKGIEKLLSHLERGVLLWMTSDGLYAKRLCQSRIYWDGPLAPYSDRPNKLEREQTCKLFDTQQFLSELQGYAHHGRPLPRFQIVLCFGEEFPDPQRQRKLITAHVEPVFARQLYYFAQQNSGHYLRGYDLPEHVNSPEDYHRPLRHSSIHE
nr:PREDICTED: interferon regulatory factor 4 [Latimeria chalumnae]|eukprot:XP_005995158.1 PREDICTED: interferon regulatory factor 4 [Latimeria chalumnae]